MRSVLGTQTQTLAFTSNDFSLRTSPGMSECDLKHRMLVPRRVSQAAALSGQDPFSSPMHMVIKAEGGMGGRDGRFDTAGFRASTVERLESHVWGWSAWRGEGSGLGFSDEGACLRVGSPDRHMLLFCGVQDVRGDPKP